jgi:hypothetical protein
MTTRFLALAIVLLTASNVSADPIRVFGSIEGGRDGAAIELQGENFSLSGQGFTQGGVWTPADCMGDCLPGEQRSLAARWSGIDLYGSATVNGTTYPFSMDEAWASVYADGLGTWTVPAFTGATVTSVRVPFILEGLFGTNAFGFEFLEQGEALINLAWSGAGWTLANSRFSIGQQAQTVVTSHSPEPATLLLLGTGLLSLLAYRRRQRAFQHV